MRDLRVIVGVFVALLIAPAISHAQGNTVINAQLEQQLLNGLQLDNSVSTAAKIDYLATAMQNMGRDPGEVAAIQSGIDQIITDLRTRDAAGELTTMDQYRLDTIWQGRVGGTAGYDTQIAVFKSGETYSIPIKDLDGEWVYVRDTIDSTVTLVDDVGAQDALVMKLSVGNAADDLNGGVLTLFDHEAGHMIVGRQFLAGNADFAFFDGVGGASGPLGSASTAVQESLDEFWANFALTSDSDLALAATQAWRPNNVVINQFENGEEFVGVMQPLANAAASETVTAPEIVELAAIAGAQQTTAAVSAVPPVIEAAAVTADTTAATSGFMSNLGTLSDGLEMAGKANLVAQVVLNGGLLIGSTFIGSHYGNMSLDDSINFGLNSWASFTVDSFTSLAADGINTGGASLTNPLGGPSIQSFVFDGIMSAVGFTADKRQAVANDIIAAGHDFVETLFPLDDGASQPIPSFYMINSPFGAYYPTTYSTGLDGLPFSATPGNPFTGMSAFGGNSSIPWLASYQTAGGLGFVSSGTTPTDFIGQIMLNDPIQSLDTSSIIGAMNQASATGSVLPSGNGTGTIGQDWFNLEPASLSFADGAGGLTTVNNIPVLNPIDYTGYVPTPVTSTNASAMPFQLLSTQNQYVFGLTGSLPDDAAAAAASRTILGITNIGSSYGISNDGTETWMNVFTPGNNDPTTLGWGADSGFGNGGSITNDPVMGAFTPDNYDDD